VGCVAGPEIGFGEEEEAGTRNRAGSEAAKIGLETVGCLLSAVSCILGRTEFL